MATYTFLVARTLTAEIEIDGENIDQAEIVASEQVKSMTNSDFTDINEESINLMEGPEGERFSGLKIV